jgi:DeoR/GlpR family transcriptional regulator of sugar metabolism
MNKSEKACIKERVLKLAKLKSTGTPADLALKFEISERTIKRIIREMRDEGAVLRYDYSRMSYVMDEGQ